MSSAGAPRAARILALAIGLVYVAVFLLVALGRIGYPFELEWMEGGAIAHVQRILAGQALYVPPSLDFVPFGCHVVTAPARLPITYGIVRASCPLWCHSFHRPVALPASS